MEEVSRQQITLYQLCLTCFLILRVDQTCLSVEEKVLRCFCRALLLPWLLLYGAGIVACLASHLYFTRWQLDNKEKTALTMFANNFNHLFSLCWREEKVTGMICLGLAFIFLILWWVLSISVPDILIGVANYLIQSMISILIQIDNINNSEL